MQALCWPCSVFLQLKDVDYGRDICMQSQGAFVDLLSAVNCLEVLPNCFDLAVITVGPATSAYLSARCHDDDGPCSVRDVCHHWKRN